MTLIVKSGDMFKERADAIVNTVNCVGVMGKGVALEFKGRWPANFKAYKHLCDMKRLKPGQVFLFQNFDMLNSSDWRFLINFPTKDHWRQKSKIEFINSGLDDLITKVRASGIRSIVMPPLGCGNGGLRWRDVYSLLDKKLSAIEDLDFIVFAPSEFQNQTNRHTKMTFPRALLLKALSDLSVHFDGRFTRIVLQKIVYFFQEMGVDFRMEFSPNEFGPYSDDLRVAFVKMEEQGLIQGFTDENRETWVTTEGSKLAEAYLNGDELAKADELIRRLCFLVEGYESPFGLELLSSVHFLTNKGEANSLDSVLGKMASWSNRKSEFDSKAVEFALKRLEEDKMVPALH